MSGDLVDSTLSEKAVQLAISSFGQLDGVVINHGVVEPVKRVADADISDWKQSFDINFFSSLTFVKAAIPFLRKQRGRIVFTSSGAAINPYGAWGAYCASKAALKSLGEVIAAEEADITTVSVRPGMVDTQMQQALREQHLPEMNEKDSEKFTSAYREGRLLRPDQPGNVIARLVLDAPKELSGQFVAWNDSSLGRFQD